MTDLHRLALLLEYSRWSHTVARLAIKGQKPGPVTIAVYRAFRQLLEGRG